MDQITIQILFMVVIGILSIFIIDNQAYTRLIEKELFEIREQLEKKIEELNSSNEDLKNENNELSREIVFQNDKLSNIIKDANELLITAELPALVKI
jgi:cell division protein FtsL